MGRVGRGKPTGSPKTRPESPVLCLLPAREGWQIFAQPSHHPDQSWLARLACCHQSYSRHHEYHQPEQLQEKYGLRPTDYGLLACNEKCTAGARPSAAGRYLSPTNQPPQRDANSPSRTHGHWIALSLKGVTDAEMPCGPAPICTTSLSLSECVRIRTGHSFPTPPPMIMAADQP